MPHLPRRYRRDLDAPIASAKDPDFGSFRSATTSFQVTGDKTISPGEKPVELTYLPLNGTVTISSGTESWRVDGVYRKEFVDLARDVVINKNIRGGTVNLCERFAGRPINNVRAPLAEYGKK